MDDVNWCHQAFYDSTGNAATASAICAVCARKTLISTSGFECHALKDVVTSCRLVPTKPHPTHYLVQGMLLEPGGVVEGTSGEVTIQICRDCQAALHKPDDRPPQYSLANGLWVGKMPWELEVLTVPEHLLIALVYLRVFIYKLFPTSLCSNVDDTHYQRGMRGTVTTYALDQSAIADMLQGNLMPRRPKILASVISLLYIGRGSCLGNCYAVCSESGITMSCRRFAGSKRTIQSTTVIYSSITPHCKVSQKMTFLTQY